MDMLERVFYSPAGQSIARRAGMPRSAPLRRGRAWPSGPIVLAPLGSSRVAHHALVGLGREFQAPVMDTPADSPPGYGSPVGAIVIDATQVSTVDALEDLRAVVRPALRSLEASGRVIILARAAERGWEAHAVARSLDGITRTIGKELLGGATANLVYLDRAAGASDVSSTLEFLLQGRSAFVDGQSWRVAASSTDPRRTDAPLQGKLVVVTGAARGIGASICRILARDGAALVAVDVAAAGQSLAAVANEVGGTTLHVDVTAADAGQRIASHVAQRGQRLYGIVHNAGIARDKLLVNTDAERWASVLRVNLVAQMHINEVLLDTDTVGGLEDGGRIVGISSTSGLAGNRGQSNYAASKAAVAGLVVAMAPDLAGRAITVNAVAPGFIETDMTARIPFMRREVFRRTNSLAQGGHPADVAETIGYLLDPASAGVTGQVIRVCGQNLVGA